MQSWLNIPPLFAGGAGIYIVSIFIYILFRPRMNESTSNMKLAACLTAISMEIIVAGLYAGIYSSWFAISIYELLLPWLILPSLLLIHLVWTTSK
ncbi:MAG: hypothetical protein ACFFED_13885 [Candidatus Thorarchaeota archaeon]